MKNKIFSIILVVTLAAGVAGCGKNDSATADTSSQEASTEVPVVIETDSEEDIEEAQETTSSRQEQFEKDKQYLLAKGLTDFGWQDYWNHFIAIEDNDERLKFAATYDRFVSTHLEFKTFYYGLRNKTVEVPKEIYDTIEYGKKEHLSDAYNFYDKYSWYTQSETPFDKWAESIILNGLKVHSKYYSDNLVDYEKNLSNIDIVNISDEEIIQLTKEDISSIRRMYLEPQNSNIVMYYAEIGESMPYSFNESDYITFESRYNSFIIDEFAESENTHQLKPWHLKLLRGGYLDIYSGKLALADRGVPDGTDYTKEEFINRIEELFDEDLNSYRVYFGLEPYKPADEWTRSYARQRAYERYWTVKGPEGGVAASNGCLDLKHVRPFTDDKWNIIDSYESIREIWRDKPLYDSLIWQGNTIWSKGRLVSDDYRNWPEKYHDHLRGENISGGFPWMTNEEYEEAKYLGLYAYADEDAVIMHKEDFKFNEYYAKAYEQCFFWGLNFEFLHYEKFISNHFIHCANGCGEYNGDYMLAQEFYSLNEEKGGHIDNDRTYMFPEVMQAFYDDKIQGYLPDITTQEEADLFMYRALHGMEDANKETLETSNFVSMEELEREREAELKALEEKDKELTNSSSNSSVYDNPYAVSNSDDAKTIDELRAFLTKNGQQTKFFTMYSTWKQLYNDNKNDVSEQEWLNRFGQYLTDDEF